MGRFRPILPSTSRWQPGTETSLLSRVHSNTMRQSAMDIISSFQFTKNGERQMVIVEGMMHKRKK